MFSWQKLRLIDFCVLVLITGVVAGLFVRFLDWQTRSFRQRWDRTHHFPQASSTPTNDFAETAGEYFHGDKYGGWHLSILSDGRYSFFAAHCTGVEARESGFVRRVEGNLVLSPIEPANSKIERTFRPIYWQGRCYMVPSERMEEFCDAVIQGDEPREAGSINHRFYLRYPAPKVIGVPELPDQWEAYLQQHLVMGEIVELMEDGRVRVDAGKAKGIEPESVLAVQGRDDYEPRRLVVVWINDESCIAVDPNPERSNTPLEVGMHLVTQK